MLWRGSARLGGVSGIDFNVLGNPAELVRKLKMNADIAVFVNLDSVGVQKATRSMKGIFPGIPAGRFPRSSHPLKVAGNFRAPYRFPCGRRPHTRCSFQTRQCGYGENR